MTKDLVSAIQRIEAQRYVAYSEMLGKQREAEFLAATVDAFDRALAELNKATPEDALPVKVPRLDIAAAVLAVLTDQGPHTLDDLAKAIERKPSQVQAAITRLGSKVEFGGAYGGDQHRCYRLAGAVEQVAA